MGGTQRVQTAWPCFNSEGRSGINGHRNKPSCLVGPPFLVLMAETFSFMMSHPPVSLGLRFTVSRKGRPRGGEWVHPANGLAVNSPWLEPGGPYLGF